MNEEEIIKQIIIEKYYEELFEILSEYINRNSKEFCYGGNFFEEGWNRFFKPFLREYEIEKLSLVSSVDTFFIDMIVKTRIQIYDTHDMGYGYMLDEYFRIGAGMDTQYENFEVVFVGLDLSRNC